MNSIVLYIASFIFKLLPETRFFSLKRLLLKMSGAKIGKNVRICSSVHIIGNGTLVIGDNTFIGPLSFLHVSSSIIIGANCNISSKVTILNGTHKIDFEGVSIAGKGRSEDVVIGDGCWICTNAIVLGSSNIGGKCIVAANSTTKGFYPSEKLLKGSIAMAYTLSQK